jgi:hypothetical protein
VLILCNHDDDAETALAILVSYKHCPNVLITQALNSILESSEFPNFLSTM